MSRRDSSVRASAPLWRRALPTLVTVAAIAVFVAAGNWQGRRMAQKEALRVQYDAALATPASPLPQSVPTEAWVQWRYRAVAVTGEYDARHQILVDNKVHAGRAGYHVVTPLKMADGRVILVNRGWIAQGATRAMLPVVPPPTGPVEVTGRINLPATGYIELQSGGPAGILWQNLDPARYAAATGIPVPAAVIEAAPDHVPGELVRDWPAPDFGSDKHRIYQVQWYVFAAMAAGLWLYFQFRRWRTPGAALP